MEQPNITSDGDAALTPVFWVVVALTGVAAGLFGDLMMVILFNVQYLAFGYHTGSFQAGVEHAPAVRRVSSLLIAGVFGGVAWFVLRRYTKGEHSEIDEAIWHGDGRLSLRRCLGTSVISEVVIGMGASLGREAAPSCWAVPRRASSPAGPACPSSSGGCLSPAAEAPAWPRSTTSHSPGLCSPPKSSAAASRCRSSCPRWPAHASRPPPPGSTCPATPPTRPSRTTGSADH